jgi:putative transposase
MLKPQFLENETYHIYNRGVEKRKIFLDDKDYFRFIHDLFEFNDENPAFNVGYYFNSGQLKNIRKPRKLLVEILIFTLMPNHFHLLLRQERGNGIVKFMQKLGTGYTMHFNQKYERVGSLFQGRFKAKLINKNSYFFHIPHYIHLNPLELIYGGSTSIDWRKAMKFLENYRWSSFLDYIGKRNFPSVTSRNFLLKFLGGEKNYREETKKWLEEKEKNTDEIKNIILD